jgi:S1-C subfamily serine protease
MKRIKQFFGDLYEYGLMAILGIAAIAVFGVQRFVSAFLAIRWWRVAVAVGVIAFVGSNWFFPSPVTPATIDPAKLVKTYGPSIFVLTPTDNELTGGTGFLVKAPSGNTYVMTNHHVCEASTNGKMLALLPEKTNPRRILLNILEMSQETDLCLLTPVPGRRAFEMAKTFEETNTNVFAIGHPYLLPNTFSMGVTQGYSEVNIIDYYLTKEGPQSKCVGKRQRIERLFSFFTGIVEACVSRTDAVQTTMFVKPGNSGSPVFSLEGKVVGVVFASSGTGSGYYIPLEDVQAFLSVY